jgi:hypothetical protein
MSHPFLYVWDANQLGLPNGIEDVPQLLEKAERENPPSSALKKFIEQLQGLALYNKALKLNAVAPYLQLVAQTAHHSYPVVALEQADVPEAQFLAVLAQIVTIARQLNIVIYDDNRLILFLPSGRILPSQRAAWWIGALDYLDDKESIKDISEVSQEVERLATDLWIRHPDYQVVEIRRRKEDQSGEISWAAIKKTSLGQQDITFSTVRLKSNFSLRVSLVLNSPIINDIYYTSNCSYSVSKSKSWALFLSLINEDMYKIEIREELIKLTGCPAFRQIKEKSQITKNMIYAEQAAFKLLPLLETKYLSKS